MSDGITAGLRDAREHEKAFIFFTTELNELLQQLDESDDKHEIQKFLDVWPIDRADEEVIRFKNKKFEVADWVDLIRGLFIFDVLLFNDELVKYLLEKSPFKGQIIAIGESYYKDLSIPFRKARHFYQLGQDKLMNFLYFSHDVIANDPPLAESAFIAFLEEGNLIQFYFGNPIKYY